MFDNSIFYFEHYNFRAVFVCIKWKQGFYDLYVRGNKQKNYCLWAEKLMDNNIFSGGGEKYCSVVVITILFLCFDVKV